MVLVWAAPALALAPVVLRAAQSVPQYYAVPTNLKIALCKRYGRRAVLLPGLLVSYCTLAAFFDEVLRQARTRDPARRYTNAKSSLPFRSNQEHHCETPSTRYH